MTTCAPGWPDESVAERELRDAVYLTCTKAEACAFWARYGRADDQERHRLAELVFDAAADRVAASQ